MREHLKKRDTPFWGVSKNDFITIFNFTKKAFELYYKESFPRIADKFNDEIGVILDIHYRESQYLLQFGIWRLQSTFETLLKQDFDLTDKRGFQRLTDEVKKCGFTFIKENELKDWIDLRNNLSHTASEMCNPEPINLIIEDIEEYSKLLFEVYEDLEKQKEKKQK